LDSKIIPNVGDVTGAYWTIPQRRISTTTEADAEKTLTEVSVGAQVFVALEYKVTAILIGLVPELVVWFGVDTPENPEENCKERL